MSSYLSSAPPPPPPPPPPPSSPSDSTGHRSYFLPFPSAAATADLPSSARLLHPPAPTTSSYNTLIRSLSRSRDCKPLALRVYRRMLFDGAAAPPDNFTFPFVLKAAAFLFALSEGTQIHAHILKLGFASDTYVANSLIHFYASCGRQSLARQLFDRMLRRTRVSWNVTIDGYVANGGYDTALDLFREMQRWFPPDEYTLQSVICACGGIGSLSLAMWAHAFIFKNFDDKVVNDVLINNSLLDAYSKCGSITIARQVFDRMPTRDVTSWNVMILGLAMHGHVDECVEAFARMLEAEKLKPNSITFVGILSACDHGGLVDEGRKYFDSMVTDFGIEPRIEHYGCMVDLLARAGLIDEALDLVSNMRCKPDAVIWRSLLDACCKRNAGVEVSESVARRALEFEDVGTSGVYVLLSRVYASANRWNDVGLVRKLMIDEGIRKEPGCSSMEMDGVVHHFVAGDTSHPRSEEIYGMLHEVEDKLALVGYKPDSSQAPMVAELDRAKEDSLRFHSERLAIAFGLLNRTPRTPIRILKNLRVCGDCHAITKLISREYNVEIIVRDRTRFHHFRDGLCSCMDYW